ncbi:MAG: hypothetical protein ETSY2_19350 [Candidatus Entotheonella gemina]|uniref:Uncharacterized protein n=1 Tax=Candidatus Entotheonella gemina TaxID=1429439 RepID=W4M793_9BACT|nr:MAG: hypothetical protein ETSY2_19350 [Candidatus Entotheonella gemina]
MAEVVVSKDQFNEFVKRMEQGFHHADQRHNDLLAAMNERFTQADQRHNDLLGTINQRFDQVDRRFDQIDQQRQEDRQAMMQQRQEDRQVMMQQFQQVDQRHSDLLAAMNQRFAQHEARLVSMENWMRTTFVTVALVAVGVAAQLFYTLLRFGLKPPTP